MASMVTTRSGRVTALYPDITSAALYAESGRTTAALYAEIEREGGYTQYRDRQPMPDSLDSSILNSQSQQSNSQEAYSQDSEGAITEEEEEPEVESLNHAMVRNRLHNRSLTPGKPKSYTHCIKESAGAIYNEAEDLPDIGSDPDEDDVRPIHVYQTESLSEKLDVVKNNIQPFSCGCFLKLVPLLMLVAVICIHFSVQLYQVRRENSRTIKSKISETLELFADIEKRTILSERRLEEIKKNILHKISDPLKDDPLSILILVTEEHRHAIEEEFQTITYIFNRAMKLSSSPPQTISEETWPTNKLYQQSLDTILSSDTYSLIISDFDQFSWSKARLFYQYCDNDNAPYNDRLFVFIVTVEGCSEGREVGQINEVLEKRWGSEEGADVSALVTRVSAVSVCVK